MKNIIYIIAILSLLSCTNSQNRTVEVSTIDSLLLNNISLQDTNDYCRMFRKLKTSDEYFQSANNRTKDCPYDSLTNLVALKEYEYAVKLDPKFWQARRNYARQLFNFNEYEKCVEQLNKTLELVSGELNPDLNIMRGEALYKLGNYKNAIMDFDIGIKYLANTERVHLLKAKAEWKLGLTTKACEDYKLAIKGHPDYETEKEFIDCK
ncbi:MAG: hypothetical protein IPL10_14745 [Bacteroidetes bacterium]|nr:hypothetical protein [Bacteroidota bacterium]